MLNVSKPKNGIESIEKELLALGAKEENLDKIIKDVNDVITKKILVLYISKFNKDKLGKLKVLPENELMKYVEEHKNEFPPLPKEDMDKIVAETWQDYFETMSR